MWGQLIMNLIYGGRQVTTQTIIVTGASRGLGAAAVRSLVKLGANVVLNARSEDSLQTLAAEVDPHKERTLVVAGDVAQIDDCQRVVTQAMEHFGRLDTVVNNAGVLEPIAEIGQADPLQWQINVGINLLGPFYLVHFALPHLKEQDGRVINVSSGAAVKAMEGWSAYCAAKAAVNHFTRVLAAEEPDVVALSFRPGVVDTEMQKTIREEGAAGMPSEDHGRFLRYHEEGELLPPDVPGRALAVLAMAAPPAWSGEFIRWNEERVQFLVNKLA